MPLPCRGSAALAVSKRVTAGQAGHSGQVADTHATAGKMEWCSFKESWATIAMDCPLKWPETSNVTVTAEVANQAGAQGIKIKLSHAVAPSFHVLSSSAGQRLEPGLSPQLQDFFNIKPLKSCGSEPAHNQSNSGLKQCLSAFW